MQLLTPALACLTSTKRQTNHPGKPLLLPDRAGFSLTLFVQPVTPTQNPLEAEGWHDFHICRCWDHELRNVFHWMSRQGNDIFLAIDFLYLEQFYPTWLSFLLTNQCATLFADTGIYHIHSHQKDFIQEPLFLQKEGESDLVRFPDLLWTFMACGEPD